MENSVKKKRNGMQAIYDSGLEIQTKNPLGICKNNGPSKPKLKENEWEKSQVDQPTGGGLESQSPVESPILL